MIVYSREKQTHIDNPFRDKIYAAGYHPGGKVFIRFADGLLLILSYEDIAGRCVYQVPEPVGEEE